MAKNNTKHDMPDRQPIYMYFFIFFSELEKELLRLLPEQTFKAAKKVLQSAEDGAGSVDSRSGVYS